MSNFTDTIDENQCLFNSIKVINKNNDSLDTALCTISGLTKNLPSKEITSVVAGYNLNSTTSLFKGGAAFVLDENICPPWHVNDNNIPLTNIITTFTSETANDTEEVTKTETVTSMKDTFSGKSREVFPVEHLSWDQFMNSYAVWVAPPTNDHIYINQLMKIERSIYIPNDGNYMFEGQADNSLTLKIDNFNKNGDHNIESVFYTQSFSNNAISKKTVYLLKGYHVLYFEATNFKGAGTWKENPAGWAVVVKNSTGKIIWDTRSHLKDVEVFQTKKVTNTNTIIENIPTTKTIDTTNASVPLAKLGALKGNITMNAYSNVHTYFKNTLGIQADLDAGYYRLKYKTGAFSYAPNDGWGTIYGSTIYSVVGGIKTKLVDIGDSTTWKNVKSTDPDISIKLAQNYYGAGAPYYKDVYFPGGTMSMEFIDSTYSDNRIHTTGAQTYDVYPLTLPNVTHQQITKNDKLLKHIQDVVSINPPMSGTTTIFDCSAVFPQGIESGVLMADGRVYCSQSNYTVGKAAIYDPLTDTIQPANYPDKNQGIFSSSGVLMADGRILLIPSTKNKPGKIYNPINNAILTCNGNWSTSNDYAYYGGTLLPDGKVYINPCKSNTSALIYDPILDTTYYSSNTPIGGSYTSLLLPNGNVYRLPCTTINSNGIDRGYIYSLKTNMFIVSNAIYPATGQNRLGGCMLPDGRIFTTPHAGNSIPCGYIYNYKNDTLTSTTRDKFETVGSAGSGPYAGGSLLPDGRIFIPAYEASKSLIYDPVNDVTEYVNVNKLIGSFLLRNGYLFIPPYYLGTTGKLIYTYHQRNFDFAALSGPFFNNATY